MPEPRPSLLFLCQTLPFPPDGGVNIRTYNVLRLLAEVYDIDAVCFYRQRIARSLEVSKHGLLPFVRSLQVYPIAQEQSLLRLIGDHLLSTVTQTVYTRHTYKNPTAHTALTQLLNNRRYDLVHVDSLDLSAYLPYLLDSPVVCVHHNVESTLLKRRAALESNPFRRGYLQMQADLMRREEEYWAPIVNLNVTCSADDQRALETIAAGACVTVVPNGVDVTSFAPPAPAVGAAASGIVFVGGMTWFPNRDGMQWFADEILPRIVVSGHRPEVTWVGRANAEAVSSFATKGVKLTGYVDDVRPYVHAARCYIAPLRVGGGTRLKLLDAWAMGQAVVSTTVGAEGLAAEDGVNILLADTPQAFAAAVQRVLTDESLRNQLGAAGRRTALKYYSWDLIGSHLRDVYATLAREADGPAKRLRIE